jgi:hypothetical protein
MSMRLNLHPSFFAPKGKLAAVSVAYRYSDQWLVIDHEGNVVTSFDEPFSAARYVNYRNLMDQREDTQ